MIFGIISICIGGENLNEEIAKNVLFELKDILDNHNIEYWLTWGTLLGAVRDKKFIEGDNDIDLISTESNFPKFKAIIEEIVDKGFKVTTNQKVAEITKNDISIGLPFHVFDKKNNVLIRVGLEEYHDKFVAKCMYYLFLLPLSKKPTTICRKLQTKIATFIFKQTGGICIRLIIPADYIFPLKTLSFYGKAFPVPKKTDEYLTYFYRNWNVRIKDKDYNHIIVGDDYKKVKGTFTKILVICPKCNKGYVKDNPHKYNDGKGKIIKQTFKCDCGNEWHEEIYVLGVVLKNIIM